MKLGYSNSLFLLLLFLWPTAPAYAVVDDREVTILSAKEVVSKRTELINYIWGTEGFPTTKLPNLPVVSNDISPIPGLENLERVDTLIVPIRPDFSPPLNSYAHHFIPVLKNDRLVILHHGHYWTYEDPVGYTNDTVFGMKNLLNALLRDGYSVLAVYMPRNNDFTTTIDVEEQGGTFPHDEFFRTTGPNPLPTPPNGSSPVRYFLEPIAAYLNYLQSRSSVDNFPLYQDFNMVGFSGGAWTTVLYAAIDPRIKLSVQINGTLPLYLWGQYYPDAPPPGEKIGDYEQRHVDGLYQIAGFPDLYVLGAFGPGRKQVQVVSRYDGCCFSQHLHDTYVAEAVGMSYDEAIKDYESRVRAALVSMGDTDLFRVEIDETVFGVHRVSWDAAFDTELAELNNGRRYVGSDSDDVAFLHGLNGNLHYYAFGGIRQIRSSYSVGVPGVLRRAFHIDDIFFRRQGDNSLVHRWKGNGAWWPARTVTLRAISDPAVVSDAVNSYHGAVVTSAIPVDFHRLEHFWWNGSDNQTEPIPMPSINGVVVRPIGTPVIMAGATGVDVFFRGLDRGVYHANKPSNGTWTVNPIGGQIMDLPTAVKTPDGGFRVYVRGLNFGLWEAAKPAGGATWAWHDISSYFGGTVITGTPAAIGTADGVRVYARNGMGGLSTFAFFNSAGWNLTTDPTVDITGSPTVTPEGVYVRDIAGIIHRFDGSIWSSLGGVFD
ncbi:MAG: hypothetical protein AB7F88_11130 [Pyrinomonadaceae bacterium]